MQRWRSGFGPALLSDLARNGRLHTKLKVCPSRGLSSRAIALNGRGRLLGLRRRRDTGRAMSPGQRRRGRQRRIGADMLNAVRSRLTYANVVATGALFLALGGGAYALTGIPDRGGVFHGCVDPKTSVLRVVKTASSCRKTKTVRRGNRRVRILGE